MKKLGAIILAALVLSACGFHFRGYRPIPTALKHLHLRTEQPNTPFFKTLNNYLREVGIDLSGQRYELTIIHEIENSRPGSMSASSRTREYQLTFTVEYQLAEKKGRLIQKPRTLTANRTLLLNTNRMLGSTSEERTLFREMHQEVARRLVDLLSSPKIVQQLKSDK